MPSFFASFTAWRSRYLVSLSKGVPSGFETLQNMRATLPSSGRQGTMERVLGSGFKNRSLLTMLPKPGTAPASKEMP